MRTSRTTVAIGSAIPTLRALDTNMVRRIKPGSPTYRFLVAEARASRRFGLPLPVLFEVSRGAQLVNHPGLIHRLGWLSSLLAADLENNRVQVLEPLQASADSFEVAGMIHARVAPPKKRRQGTVEERALAWYQDILIAATTWGAGFDLVTEDTDFSVMLPYLPGLGLVTAEAAGLDA